MTPYAIPIAESPDRTPDQWESERRTRASQVAEVLKRAECDRSRRDVVRDNLAKYRPAPIQWNAVICVETGEAFESESDAAKSIGLKSRTSIALSTNDGFAANGLHFIHKPTSSRASVVRIGNRVFGSIAQASRVLKIDSETIRWWTRTGKAERIVIATNLPATARRSA